MYLLNFKLISNHILNFYQQITTTPFRFAFYKYYYEDNALNVQNKCNFLNVTQFKISQRQTLIKCYLIFIIELIQ